MKILSRSPGIGLQFCLNLAKADCRIIAAARRVDRLTSLCHEINNLDSPAWRAVAIRLDITADGATIAAAVRLAWDAFGHIDALVNNASIIEEEWEHTFKTNLRGALGGGSVINISPVLGLNRGQLPGFLAYTSSKIALDMVTKIWHLNWE
ncbi:hypothetical protein KY285_009432 [Solanum tuberosum]|nr:hypothetical protein KY285_009432 [Solanum tuberosum]